MLSDRQLTREAVKCFKRLSEPGAHLRDLSAHLSKDVEWGIFVARNDFRKPVVKLPCDVVEGFIRKQWIEVSGAGRACITDAGAKWFKRTTTADPFRSQHQERASAAVADAYGDPVVVEVNTSESPLTWLRSRKDAQGNRMLGSEQFAAGERLRRDFELAQLRAHVTANWDFDTSAGRPSKGMRGDAQVSDTAIAAKQRFYGAMDAVGPELAAALMEVCCFLNGIADVETALCLPRRSGKVILQIGLNALARHYGLLQTHNLSASGVRHWGQRQYRPKI